MDRSKDIGPGESLRRREGESAADDVEGHVARRGAEPEGLMRRGAEPEGLMRRGGEGCAGGRRVSDDDVEGHELRREGETDADAILRRDAATKSVKLDDPEEQDTEGHTGTRIR